MTTTFRRCLPAVVAGMLALVVGQPAVSVADPDDVDQARRDLHEASQASESAETRLADLSRRAELAVEAYNQARSRHDRVTERVRDAVARLDRLAGRVDTGQRAADAFARELYQGGAAYELDALLGATDVTDARTRAIYLRSAAETHLAEVEDLRDDRADYVRDLGELERLRGEAEARRQAVDEKRARVTAMLEAQSDQVRRLRAAAAAARADYDRAVAAERARLERQRQEQLRRERLREQRQRQERQRQERERQQRLARMQRQRQHQQATGDAAGGASGTHGGTSAGGGTVADVRVASGAAGVVEAALSQLGKPYEWAAEGPDTYDCSGLTLWAWAEAGVSLPHSSRMQYATTTRVAVADIQPGDLVFFGDPIHHVAMYIGDGKVVEAPYSGAHVRINDRAMARDDLVAVGRVGES